MAAVEVTSTKPFTSWELTVTPPDPTNPGAPSILDVWEMMLTIAQAGYVCLLKCFAPTSVTETGVALAASTFQLTITKEGFPDQDAPVGYYVVFDHTYATVVDAATYKANYAAAAPPPPPP